MVRKKNYVMPPSFQDTLVSIVVEQIFRTEYKQYQKEIDQLIEKNIALYPYYDMECLSGFNYKDKWYPGSYQLMRSDAGLHPTLQPAMHRLSNYMKDVEDQKQLITQFLRKLLAGCSNLQQARNELPECVVDLDHEFWAGCERQHEPTMSIQGSPMDIRQYTRVLEMIQHYCVMRFLL